MSDMYSNQPVEASKPVTEYSKIRKFENDLAIGLTLSGKFQPGIDFGFERVNGNYPRLSFTAEIGRYIATVRHDIIHKVY